MGLLETLARVDKVFAIDNFPILEGDLVQAIEYFQMLPVYLESWGRPQTLILVIGDDIASAAGQGVLKEAKLRVQLENLLPADRLEIRLNGQAIPPVSAVDGEGWLIYEPDPSLYRLGNNEVCIRLVKRTPEAKSPVMVKAVEVPVKYR